MERIQAQGQEKIKLAIATLTRICYPERPLEVDELCHALALEIGLTDFDSESDPSIGAVLSCCQGLITVDQEASIYPLYCPRVSLRSSRHLRSASLGNRRDMLDPS